MIEPPCAKVCKGTANYEESPSRLREKFLFWRRPHVRGSLRSLYSDGKATYVRTLSSPLEVASFVYRDGVIFHIRSEGM